MTGATCNAGCGDARVDMLGRVGSVADIRGSFSVFQLSPVVRAAVAREATQYLPARILKEFFEATMEKMRTA